ARSARPALIVGPGGGIVPAPLLAELIAHGATMRFVGPTDCLTSPGYRPSTALDRFVRTRDLTCRFPGCDRPATHADIDHTVPYPLGATHPGNTKCYCRPHHLLKTFWQGWRERQTPDGRLHLISPTGHTYTTTPLSTLLFPSWNTNTAPPPPTGTAQRPGPGRHLMMPTRRRNRTQNHTAYIRRERHLNAQERARGNTKTVAGQPYWDSYRPPPSGNDPPPF
ncbi:HNH endonuclease signature motif containing protein, partial [Mycolicibacterium sp. 018/SC-01/001]|uniref:HNH endonuclease signature motif containing protein n=1 Tax=Mycolicibacterium sp. 018/SC-01/001 TaxID=2592069 RepID=UPI00163DE073